MSTPPHLRLPECAGHVMLATTRGQFAVLDARPGLDAPPRGSALLVPGLTGSKEDFLPLLAPLAAAGYRCQALDQRGQFQTPGPADPAAYRLEALGADLLAIAADLPPPVHLVGHSFGGLVVRAAALAAPQAAASLTFLCSGPGPVRVAREVERLGMLISALEVMTPAQLWALVEAADEHAGVAPEVRAFLARRFAASSATGLAAMGATLLDTADRVVELAATGLPCLVTYGVNDMIWLPDEQAAMARRLRARHVVIADAAHSPAVEQPARTAQVLVEFWDEIAGPRG